jgi:2-keto-4-pentenoate hydratase
MAPVTRLPLVAADRFAPGMARQLARFREALAAGMPRRGWKIGINVPEVLRRLDLPHPGVGWLDGRRVFAEGTEIPLRSGARLHVEPEVAIRVSQTVAPGCSTNFARSCIDAVHPALEIVSYAHPVSGLDDVVANCMFHDATVLGDRAPLEAARDLGRQWPALRVGDRSAGPPRADLVPSDLGELVAFVATYLAAFGESLETGDLVLSGSFTASAAPLAAGEQIVAEFGPLGRVSAGVAG